jgi:UDP-2,3-diacylglucosamine hydrolase
VIAGSGNFPLLLASAARSSGYTVFGFCVKGFASEEFARAVDDACWLELGQFGKLIDLMHEKGVRSVAMVGRIPHTSILQYRHFDFRALKLLGRTLNRKADSLLGSVTAEFEAEGFHVLDTTHFLRALLPQAGLLTPQRPLTGREAADIEFGYPIAKAVAGQDIGQTIVVKDKMVIAVEAAEGTDECITRAGQVGGEGCVVVKVSKPRQDRRFDVPVVGRDTIESMQKAGCHALAVTANETLIIGLEEVVELAQNYNIAVVAHQPAAAEN